MSGAPLGLGANLGLTEVVSIPMVNDSTSVTKITDWRR